MPLLVWITDFLLFEQVRRASVDETPSPGVSDEEIEAQIIEDALCPSDDLVEASLSGIIGLDAYKHHIRGLRRTVELHQLQGTVTSSISPHLVLVGNPGTGRSTAARALAGMLFEMGVVPTRKLIECGRDDLIDRKSEAKTVFKTRRLLERANGGVLFWNEPYTLLPSTARPRGRDHGAAALREMARSLTTTTASVNNRTGQQQQGPVFILTGTPLDMQRILSSDIGFKGHFWTRLELADLTPEQIGRMFLAKLHEKGLVAAEGVTTSAVAELIRKNLDREWMVERNGRIADLLLTGVRSELRKRAVWDDTVSKGSLSPLKLLSPGSSRMPAYGPAEVFVTYEDIQNAIVNGM